MALCQPLPTCPTGSGSPSCRGVRSFLIPKWLLSDCPGTECGLGAGRPELSFSRDTSGLHVCGQGPGPLWASGPSFSRQEAGRGEGVAPRNRVATSHSFYSSRRSAVCFTGAAQPHLPPPQG